MILELNEAAVVVTELPQATCAAQQIEVREAAEGQRCTRHPISGFEQRLIIGFAVIGHQHVELGKMRRKAVQHASLFAEITHEELAQTEALSGDATHANQKRVRAGATGETSGFGVEKRPAGAVRRGNTVFGDGA